MKDLILEYRSSPTASPNHHRITSKDKAIIIGVSKIEEFNTHLISSATENDANVVHDIFTQTQLSASIISFVEDSAHA